MTNEKWLRWAVARHFRQKGFKVNMKGVRVGNAIIDGEVIGDKWRLALEIKSGHDDVIRGLGQLAAALAYGYNSAALVVSLRHARRLKPKEFDRENIVVLGVDSKAQIRQVYP
jgi:sulfatase maturation enzyme AslB (radical SAM superfamily)